jgi:predicted transposase/invertase (TIGR01784 family)
MNIIQFSKDDELLDLRYDHVFKAVFTRESEASRIALSDLISALIGRVVKVETTAANEPPIEWDGDRRMRFDISCRTKTGELVNIEMSFDHGKFAPERFEYHEAKLFIGQGIHGKDKKYSDLKEAYQITILSNDLFFPDERLIHTFQYYDPDSGVTLNGKTRIVIMELLKAKQAIEKPVSEMAEYEAWAAYFGYLTEKGKRAKINEIVKTNGGIAMASEVLATISPDEREYFLRLSEEMYALDVQNRETMARDEGRAEGRREGEQNIINLLKSGKSPEEIIKLAES